MFGDDLEPKDGGPAFAAGAANNETGWTQEGMSLRDWFAGQALPEAVADYSRKDHLNNAVLPHAAKLIGTREDIIARQAYRYADAMLAARNDEI